jgi:AmpE protein
MSFLIIIITVFMVRQGEWIGQLQHDEWFYRWQGRAALSGNYKSWLALLVVVGIPVIALSILLYVLGAYWWLTFVINAIVLLYAIGRGNWHDECDSWVLFFAERDPLILKQKIAAPGANAADVTDVQVEHTWLEARATVLQHQLDGFYTVVFLFFVIGAPAALLYRLLYLYQQYKVKAGAHATELSEASLLLWMMEWLPVRVMALLFCLVGNFTTGFWVLKQIVLDSVLTSTEVLARCADAALFLDGSVDDDALEEGIDENKTRTEKMIERMESRALEQKTLGIMRRYSVELQALLQRSEWAFLVLIALVALV